jgi:hypothetical protein
MFGQNLVFGRFDHRVQPGHSVLLLRVGGLTIAEWSRDGPCSIWDETDGEKGPRLFQRYYSSSELKKIVAGDRSNENMSRQGVFWHRGADTYAWQGNIAEYLRKRRRLILSQENYRVR